MTLDQQISAATLALEELTIDEAELSRLQVDQVAEIDALKATGSRDFATLATLEGKRAALAAMLGEQRTSIDAARAQVVSLEAEKVRAEALAVLRDQVAGLTARRQRVDALITEMADTLAEQLARITAERMTWHEELEAVRSDMGALFRLPAMGNIGQGGDRVAVEARSGWAAACEELGEGADLALIISPSGRRIGGLSLPYDLPNTAKRLHSTPDMVRQPLSRYFDRPVTLALAGVLAEVNLTTPHLLKSQEA